MTTSKKDAAKKTLDAGTKSADARLTELDEDAAKWVALAEDPDTDPIAAACYREQAGSVARLRALEAQSLRLRVEHLERNVQLSEG